MILNAQKPVAPQGARIGIGDFRWWTDSRGLAATVATLGVPFKNPVPITNEYSPENPKPSVSCGHPAWRPGKVKWWFTEASDVWNTSDRGQIVAVRPKDICVAFFNGKAASDFPAQIKELNEAFTAKDMARAQLAWNALRDALPFVLAGFMAMLVKNYLLIWLPMLKKAWTQTTIPNGEGHIHMSTNPTDEVKNAFL